MSVRSRRAAAPVSSSASTTMRPLTMWSPPANLSIDATSALRQQVFVIWVEASSAFTCAVIAMDGILSCRSTTLAGIVDDAGEGGREQARIVAWLRRDGEVVDHQPGTPLGHGLRQQVSIATHGRG